MSKSRMQNSTLCTRRRKGTLCSRELVPPEQSNRVTPFQSGSTRGDDFTELADSLIKSITSRLAKKPIQVPEKAEVSVSSGNVSVKGPVVTLPRHFSEAIGIAIDNKTFVLTPKNEEITTRMLWGTTASHLMNMLKGVCEPFVKKLIVEGIGFKSEVKGEELVMNLGFSHQVKVKIPKGLGVKA